MAKNLKATFGKTAVEIKTHHLVQPNPQHPSNAHPAIATAFVGKEQLEDDGKSVEHVASTEDQAEALMIRDLEKRFGPRT